MKRKWLMIGTLIGLLAGPAAAKLEEGDLAPDIEAAEWLNVDHPVSLKEYRGMVVVLFFWVSFHDGGEMVMPWMNILENSWAFGRHRGLAVIGVTEATRGQIKDSIDNTKAFFPIAVGSKAAEEYEIESFPHVVVLDPEGKVVWSGWPGQIDELTKKIGETMSKTPPSQTHPLEKEKVQEELEEARDAFHDAKYRDAYRAAQAAYDRAVSGDPLKTRSAAMLDLVEAMARDKVAEAGAAVFDKQYAKAAGLLRDVMQVYRGTGAGVQAKHMVEKLRKKYPEFEAVMQEQAEEAVAAAGLLDAHDAIRERKFGEGWVKLTEVIEKYPRSEAAGYAREIKQRIEQRPAVMAYVREASASQDCEMWLSQARSYTSVRRYDKARELLRKVIDQYPNTTYANQAADQLAKLP